MIVLWAVGRASIFWYLRSTGIVLILFFQVSVLCPGGGWVATTGWQESISLRARDTEPLKPRLLGIGANKLEKVYPEFKGSLPWCTRST